MSYLLHDAEFVAGADKLTALPGLKLPEIAFIGRSNVGKSTLINRLTRRKALARTSSTPGRTQEINLFKTRLVRPDNPPQEIVLVDLPGFGYARFAKSKREELSRLTVEYIHSRRELEAVCLLNDCRRFPEAEELAIRDLAFQSDRLLLVVLTKLDKLKKSQRKKQIEKIAASYHLEPADLVLEGEKLGASKLIERVMLALG